METLDILASISIFFIFMTVLGTLSLTIISIQMMTNIRNHVILPDDLYEKTAKLGTMMKIGMGVSVIGGIFTSIILPKVWKYRSGMFESIVSSEPSV